MSIYPEYVHVVASQAAGITSVAGFRGKRVALGPEGSGTEQNALQVLEADGLKVTDLAQAERIDTAEAVTRMKAGQLDAAFFTVGASSAPRQGSPRRRDRPARPGAAGSDRAKLIAKLPFYWLDEIPAGTYPGQTAAVSTPSLRVLLLTSGQRR